jgi:hypothetical protein
MKREKKKQAKQKKLYFQKYKILVGSIIKLTFI